MSCALVLVLASLLPAADPPAIDLRATAPAVDDRHARVRIRLDGNPILRDADLNRIGGAWTPLATGPSTAPVDASGLRLADGRLSGTLAWAGGEVAVEGVAAPMPDGPVDHAVEDPELRFWRDLAASQGGTATLRGRWSMGSASGAIAGTIAPPARPGHWDMGEASPDGLRLRFDLGRQRRNWNTSRMAQLALPAPLDLRGIAGVRIRVATPRPRTDVEVSLWLREADGSWWYWRSAVALAAGEAAATCPFRLLQEAEWVAPGSHMDEDYVFDRAAVSHIGVGIIDPFGVGPVDFTLTELSFVPGADAAPPATAAVHASWRDVNGFSMVPVGIFGGFAPSLPRSLRPGSQRHLYAGRFPRIPRLAWAQIEADDLPDPDALLARLQAPADTDPVAARLRGRWDAIAAAAAAAAAADGRKSRREPASAMQTLAQLRSEAERAAERALRPPAKAKSRAGAPPPADAENAVEEDGAADARESAPIVRRMAAERLAAFLRPLVADPDLPGPGLGDPAGRSPAPPGSATHVAERNRKLLVEALPGLIAPPSGDGPSEAFFVDCLGERKEPAPLLFNPDWRKSFADFGREFARNCRREGYQGWFEFWNEPYLNWAERSRVNYDLRFYRTDLAGEDQPVRIKRPDGSTHEEDIVPHLAWRKRADGDWQVYDPTAFSYWSGRGNGWIYDRMFAACAAAIKAENPSVLVSAGWGFRWQEDHWAAWDMLYKPTIDRGIAWIDLVHEHHYQGDTRAMAGSYEVLTAYCQTAHGKWVRSINTEANDLLDAPSRGAIDTLAKAEAATQYRQMCYNIRDIVYAVQESPDKLAARAMIHPARNGKLFPYADVTMRFLRDLRGRMLSAQTGDRDLWCVASVDGTDPLAPTPGGGLALACVVWNDARTGRPVSVDIAPPPGLRFAGPATVASLRVDRATFAIGIEEGALPTAPDQPLRWQGDLAERSGVAIRIPLDGTPAPAPVVERRQRFARDILLMVRPDAPARTRIEVDPALIRPDAAVALRLVVEGLAEGEGELVVQGRRYALPATRDADNGNTILMLPFPAAELRPILEVEAVCAPGHAGWRLCMASVAIDATRR